MFGEHDLPVRSAVTAPEFRCTLSFCVQRLFIASAMALLFTSSTASTSPRSNHSRTMLSAMSVLFW